jgi:hypothetical protein
MVRKSLLFAVLAVIALFTFTAEAQALTLGVEGRYWFTDLKADAKVSNASIIGSNIDLVNTLNVEPSNNFGELRAFVGVGSHKLRYGYMPMRWTGTKVLSQSVTFNGKTYTAATSVDTEINLVYHRLAYEYDFIDLLNNRLGILLEAKVFDSSASIKANALGFNESKSLFAPIPAVGITGQVGLPFLFSVGGEVTGMSFGSYGHIVDAEGGVNLTPAPFITITGGYRYFKLHVAKDNDSGNFNLTGPFVMLKASF